MSPRARKSERPGPRGTTLPKKTVEELAEAPALKLGDPRSMCQILGTFAPDEDGNLCREEIAAKTDERKSYSPLQQYRELVAAVGARIAPLSEGGAVTDGQGITMQITKPGKVTTVCKLTIPPDVFMRISAYYGYDVTHKITDIDSGRWEALKAEAAAAKAAIPATGLQ